MLHGKYRHVMCGSVVKSYSWLSQTYRVGKRAAPGYNDDTTGAGGQRFDPISQMLREGKTAAKLDDDRSAATHLLCHFRISFASGWIEMMYLGHLRGPAAYNLDAGTARPDFELFDPNRNARHSWVSQ